MGGQAQGEERLLDRPEVRANKKARSERRLWSGLSQFGFSAVPCSVFQYIKSDPRGVNPSSYRSENSRDSFREEGGQLWFGCTSGSPVPDLQESDHDEFAYMCALCV